MLCHALSVDAAAALLSLQDHTLASALPSFSHTLVRLCADYGDVVAVL